MAKVSSQGRFYRCVPGKNVIINFRYHVAKIIYIVFVRQVGYNMIKECRERWDRSMEKLQDVKLKKILMELAEMLQEVYRDKLKEVILYGSVARGTATDDSDVDIMVLIDGTDQELRSFEDKLSDVSTDISIKYFKVFSIIDVSYQEYMNWMKVSPFYRNVSEEGVVLYAA